MTKHVSRALSVFGPFLGLIVVYGVFLAIAPAKFHSLYNTKTILQQTVIIGTAALGMTVVIISAGIDLSVGSQVALGTVVAALVLRRGGGDDMVWYLPLLATAAAVAACTCCGAINGLLVSGLGITPFIVTLGMMQILRGIAKRAANLTTVNAPANWLQSLMVVEQRRQDADGQWYGVWHSIAPGIWIMLALLAIMWAMLRYTVFGRHIYAVGSNEATARLCGIAVGIHRVWVYALCGLLTGIAAIMQFSTLNLGDPTGGVAFELDVIASVIIGGGSFSGGAGSVIGSMVGALMIATLRNGCVLAGVKNHWQAIIIGAIIIGVAAIDVLKQRREQ